ncbi:MAG: Fur family transcriptional regulator [Bdellovibrionales bacterium]
MNTEDQIKTVEKLKARGVRPTVHRIALAAYILKEHQHFTADDLYNWADLNLTQVSRATIYNTLNEFVAVGLIRAFYSPQAARLIYDSNTSNHFHLYDSDANQIFDIDPSQVQVNADSLQGYQIDHVDVVFRGRRVT